MFCWPHACEISVVDSATCQSLTSNCQGMLGAIEQEFRAEVELMERLKHPNIVMFMGACMQPPNLAIITEYCTLGSLHGLLHR